MAHKMSIKEQQAVKKILISKKDIKKKVKEIGQQISNDYINNTDKSDDEINKTPIICICILKGSIIFAADLIRQITIPLEVEFLSISSYGDSTKSSGQVKIILDLKKSIEGKNVLIIEDILDTGLTLNYLYEMLSVRKPKTLKICTLLRKVNPDVHIKLPVDYCGFDISKDDFVIGYGLDYAEKYRELPYVGIINESVL
jgi:hypoxanthine phosphoribosyltransferase